MLGHLGALVPGQRLAQLFGQRGGGQERRAAHRGDRPHAASHILHQQRQSGQWAGARVVRGSLAGGIHLDADDRVVIVGCDPAKTLLHEVDRGDVFPQRTVAASSASTARRYRWMKVGHSIYPSVSDGSYAVCLVPDLVAGDCYIFGQAKKVLTVSVSGAPMTNATFRLVKRIAGRQRRGGLRTGNESQPLPDPAAAALPGPCGCSAAGSRIVGGGAVVAPYPIWPARRRSAGSTRRRP